MTNFLSILSLIVKLIPVIKETIAALEASFPESGNGPAKKEIVNIVLDQVFSLATDVTDTYIKAKPAISIIIDAFVSLMFKKKTD